MTTLSSLLGDERDSFWTLKPKSFEPRALRKIVDALDGDINVEGAGEDDLDVVQQRLIDAVRYGTVDQLQPRDLRVGARALFRKPSEPGRISGVTETLCEEVQRLSRRSALNALIDCYLDSFQDGDEDIARLGVQLGLLTRSWAWRPQSMWPKRLETFALFDAERAPQKIADAVLGSEFAIGSVLETAGLNTELRKQGGLAEAAFRRAARDTARRAGQAAIPLQTRLIEWARITKSELAYPSAWPDYADGLFGPWAKAEPTEKYRQLILDAALAYGRDPRVMPARWKSCPTARDVLLRWLTRASVEQFFDIVSRSMTDRPDMWVDRRKFWTRYLKAGHISEAWVVFGADGARLALDAARRNNEKALEMFGRLASGGGRGAQHAALIMRLGDLTIVEWSHNGKYNIWRRGDGGTPALYKHNSRGWPDYDAQELMNAPESGSHTSNWQWRVEYIITDYTGLRP